MAFQQGRLHMKKPGRREAVARYFKAQGLLRFQNDKKASPEENKHERRSPRLQTKQRTSPPGQLNSGVSAPRWAGGYFAALRTRKT